MNFKPVALSLLLMGMTAGCVTTQPVDSNPGLEDLVTCRNQTSAAAAFELDGNRDSFARLDEQGGNFRIPVEPLFAFGSPVRYFGFKGVGQAAGPNAFLEADPEALRPSLEQRLGGEMIYSEEHDRYFHAIKQGRRTVGFVTLYREEKQDLSVVMCALLPRY